MEVGAGSRGKKRSRKRRRRRRRKRSTSRSRSRRRRRRRRRSRIGGAVELRRQLAFAVNAAHASEGPATRPKSVGVSGCGVCQTSHVTRHITRHTSSLPLLLSFIPKQLALHHPRIILIRMMRSLANDGSRTQTQRNERGRMKRFEHEHHAPQQE